MFQHLGQRQYEPQIAPSCTDLISMKVVPKSDAELFLCAICTSLPPAIVSRSKVNVLFLLEVSMIDQFDHTWLYIAGYNA